MTASEELTNNTGPQCPAGDIRVETDVLTTLGGVNSEDALRGVQVKWHFL